MTPTYVQTIGRRVSIFDIEDADAFVRSTIHTKVKLALDRDEREMLHAEGMVQLLTLAAKFKPQMDGYEQEGSFAGYAAVYLPRKIFSAWHDWHPEHVQHMIDMPDGSRKKRYVYGEAPASLDQKLSERANVYDTPTLRLPGNFVK